MKSTDFHTRRQWFDDYAKDVSAGDRMAPDYIFGLTCPCCGYSTLEDRVPYECCILCGWEMDYCGGGQHIDEDEKDEHSGANHCTLAQARHNFEKFYDTWIKRSGTIYPLPGTIPGWNDEDAIANRKKAADALNQMLAAQTIHEINALFEGAELALSANIKAQQREFRCPIRKRVD